MNEVYQVHHMFNAILTANPVGIQRLESLLIIVLYGNCWIADEGSSSSTWGKDGDTRRQNDNAMAIHIELACMVEVVM